MISSVLPLNWNKRQRHGRKEPLPAQFPWGGRIYIFLQTIHEFRGMQDGGWSTASDAHLSFDDYLNFLQEGPLTRIKARVAVAFYCHLAEASGFYEIPKNLLWLAGGDQDSLWPFHKLVEKHRVSRNVIAPNA